MGFQKYRKNFGKTKNFYSVLISVILNALFENAFLLLERRCLMAIPHYIRSKTSFKDTATSDER
jgi:hypothetical protein